MFTRRSRKRRRGLGGEHGAGELGVGDEGEHLEPDRQQQVGDVHVPEHAHRAPGARQLGEQQVLEDEEEDEDRDRPTDLAAELGEAEPPPRRFGHPLNAGTSRSPILRSDEGLSAPSRKLPADAGPGHRADLQRGRATSPGSSRRPGQPCPDAGILVVDDGSPDGTAERGRGAAVVHPDLHLLAPAEPSRASAAPIGPGSRWGIEHGYEVMVEMDADGSHDPAALAGAHRPGRGGPRGGHRVPLCPGRLDPEVEGSTGTCLSKGGNVYASVVLGLGVADSTAGFRAYAATRPVAASPSTRCGPRATGSRSR